MIITMMIAQYIIISGLGYLLYRQYSKYEERIDKLLRYIKPDTYIKNKGIDEFTTQLQLFMKEMAIEKKKQTQEPTTVDKFLSKV